MHPFTVRIVNKQTHTWLTVYYTVLYLSRLHVSTLMRHPEGALIRRLLSYINVFMQSWWCFERNSHIRLLELLKHWNINTVFAIINYIVVTILGNFLRWPYIQSVYWCCYDGPAYIKVKGKGRGWGPLALHPFRLFVPWPWRSSFIHL
jgi:hypothetical protein